jgi:hypothetical protein
LACTLLLLLQARGCSAAVFGLPAVQAVINYKWHTWAKKFLLYELACYLAWLAGYTAFTLLFQQEVRSIPSFAKPTVPAAAPASLPLARVGIGLQGLLPCQLHPSSG